MADQVGVNENGPGGATDPSPTRAPTTPALPRASRWYLLPSFLIVVTALAMLYWGYGQAPIPPGADPGHWLSVSKAFVGQSYPGGDSTLQPFLYPPLTFPLLGVVLVLTGSPITAGFLFAGLLLVAYGLSVLHLARRFLLSGPFQVLFVGLALLNGTTLQILFWGGYPNFLAFVFFNEALVFLLAFSRSRSLRDSLLFYAMAALLFLTHDLTFAIFLATLLLVALLLLAQDRRWWRLFASWPNLYGLLALAGVIGVYVGATALFGIPHPGYLFANPAAFYLDNIGELFRPFGYAPLWYPVGTPVALSVGIALAILVVVPLGSAFLLLAVRRVRPSWIPPRLSIALGALMAAFLVPVGGYLFHIDTDYPRFVFFFATPVALVVALTVERLTRGWWWPSAVPAADADRAPDPAPRTGPSRWRRPVRGPRSVTWWTLHLAVLAVLLLVAAAVSAPTVRASEQTYATPSHTPAFLDAVNWLRQRGPPGAVLTDTTDSQRWIQALADRNAFDPGDTWLEFYPSQVLQSEESYSALNSHYAVSNNEQVWSFSGWSGEFLNESPLYSVFAQGIALPIVRVNSSTFVVTLLEGSVRHQYTYDPSWNPTSPVYTSAPTPTLTATYHTSEFDLVERARVETGGTAVLALDVIPSMPNATVQSLSFNLFQPQPTAVGHWNPVSQVCAPGVYFCWNDTVKLGQLSGTTPISTSGTWDPRPDGSLSHPIPPPPKPGPPLGQYLVFDTPPVSGPFQVTLALSTRAASNPATVFPPFFDTNEFLNTNAIHFLLLQNTRSNQATFGYFETEFGFAPVYSNSGWKILWR